ncbi:MAG: class I SAM-dependent methyltransferase [Acidimicrobiia bacterium]
MSTDHVIAGQIDYYRARAAEYDSWFNRTGRYDKGEAVNQAWFDEAAVVRADLAGVPIDVADVLELAPGTGIWTEQLVKRARHVTAVDASPEMVDINRVRLGVDAGKVAYVIADLFAWEPAQTYDAVVFCFWISHIPQRLLDGFLSNVAQALRPGGSVFFLDAQREPASQAIDHVLPDQGSEVMARKLDDGREFTIVKNFWEAADLERRCSAVGLDVEVRTTERFFMYGVGIKS